MSTSTLSGLGALLVEEVGCPSWCSGANRCPSFLPVLIEPCRNTTFCLITVLHALRAALSMHQTPFTTLVPVGLCFHQQSSSGRAVFPKTSDVPAWLTPIFKSMFALRWFPAAPHCTLEPFPGARPGAGHCGRTKEQSFSISGRTKQPWPPPDLCFASKKPLS